MPDKTEMRLALVDDHKLFRKGLINLIELVCSSCKILFEADNGIDLQEKMLHGDVPDIILMDINMPQMDGFASVEWLKKHYPNIKILVVSMVEKEESIVRMLKLGVKGYLSKDVEPKELGEALNAIMNRGFYYTDFITGKLVHSLQTEDYEAEKMLPEIIKSVSDREKDFLKLACTELTYNEIAAQMFLSPKTIDGYRNNLFEKLKVKSRVGMALYAVKHGMVTL